MMQKLIDAYELEREMFRRCIDTNEEINKGRAKWDSGLWIRYKVFEDAITLAQRVDAVEVVRCKDCKWCEERQGRTGNVYNLCVYLNTWVDEDHFCSCGERRKNR